MKKYVLIIILSVVGILNTEAQEIGVRFGDVIGGNIAVDGVLSTGKYNRIHADVSFGNGLGVDFLWDFYRPMSNEALNWYIGAGPYAVLGDPFQLGAAGELGLEYRFKGVPVVLGADWRPYFRLIDNTDIWFNSFGVNIRWIF